MFSNRDVSDGGMQNVSLGGGAINNNLISLILEFLSLKPEHFKLIM